MLNAAMKAEGFDPLFPKSKLETEIAKARARKDLV